MSASMTFGASGHRAASAGVLRFVNTLFTRPLTRVAAAKRRIAKSIREANDVRALARSVESHSPGFAADLFAAASRHESQSE